MKFLDDSGLTKLWNKIKDGFVKKDSNNSISVNSIKGISDLRNNITFQDKLIRFRVGNQSAQKIELNTAKTPQTTIFHKLVIDSTGDIPNQVVIDTDSVLNMARIYRGTQNLYIGTDEDAGYTYIAGSLAGFDNINCSALEDEGAIAWKLLENSYFELGNSITDGNIYIWYNGKRYQLDISALISSGILK